VLLGGCSQVFECRGFEFNLFQKACGSMKHYRMVGLNLDGTIPGLKASLLSETGTLLPSAD
jgi:hypothetical protein